MKLGGPTMVSLPSWWFGLNGLFTFPTLWRGTPTDTHIHQPAYKSSNAPPQFSFRLNFLYRSNVRLQATRICVDVSGC